MNRLIIILFSILSILPVTAQVGPSNRSLAEEQINYLRNGTLVVRLKTNQRSIANYRNAGQHKLADRLEGENRLLNLNLMRSFLLNFNFCKVLFINSTDTRKLLNHEPYIFLNEKMQIDSSITISSDTFYIAEYGAAMSSEKTGEYSYDMSRTQESTTPSSTSALVLMDTTLKQLREPFPYFAVLSIVAGAGTIMPGPPQGFTGLGPGSGPTDAFNPTGGTIPTYKPDPTIPSNDRPESFGGKNKAPTDDKKTPYDKAVKNWNKKMIDFFGKVWLKRGKYMTADAGWWAEHNPNKNTDEKIAIIYSEMIKTIDNMEKFKTK